MEVVETIPKLRPRAVDGHKGDFGKVCIIAGSVGMSGAAALAGRAALRGGAGLVRVATAESALATVASIEPCFTTTGLPEDASGRISAKAVNKILDLAGEHDATAFGPGIGQSRGLCSVAEAIVQQEGLRLVIDADGLNNLSRLSGWSAKVKGRLVLTPHPGEMRRLWRGIFREQMPEKRLEQAVEFAQRTGVVVVLKGAGTVVAGSERVYTNCSGNAGMATAGAGDVLTGLITALMGQGLDGFKAAVLGVYVHGLAGDIAAEKTGQVSLIATDIIECLGEAFGRVV